MENVYFDYCLWRWGFHSCDLSKSHEGVIHRCGTEEDGYHSEYNSETNMYRHKGYLTNVEDEVGVWLDWLICKFAWRDDV